MTSGPGPAGTDNTGMAINLVGWRGGWRPTPPPRIALYDFVTPLGGALVVSADGHWWALTSEVRPARRDPAAASDRCIRTAVCARCRQVLSVEWPAAVLTGTEALYLRSSPCTARPKRAVEPPVGNPVMRFLRDTVRHLRGGGRAAPDRAVAGQGR